MPNAQQRFIALQPHQRAACDFLHTHPFAGLFLPMGAGKTATVLAYLCEKAPAHHVLIVGPKPVVRSTWTAEIEKFGLPVRVRSLVQDGKGRPLSKDKRLEAYASIAAEPPSVWFVNREMVPDLVERVTDPRDRARTWPFPTVVLDEAQSFKSPRSKRFKALKSVRPGISNLIELTGTPAPNSLEDVWALVYLLDGGARLGATITSYREKYFRPGRVRVNGYPVQWIPLPGAREAIYARISDIAMSMDALSHLMPPVTVDDRILRLDKAQRDAYEKLKRDMVLEFDADNEVVAANAAVLSAKLLQMASGAIYVNGGNSQFQVIHRQKADECVRIAENAGSPVLVAYHFKSDLKMLEEAFGQAQIPAETFDGSPEMVKRWNDQDIPVMFLQPASAGHGLNLQFGGHTLVWHTMPWNLEHYLQTNARIARQGQANPVMIHRLIVEDTIDEKVADALSRKQVDQQGLLDAIRQCI